MCVPAENPKVKTLFHPEQVARHKTPGAAADAVVQAAAAQWAEHEDCRDDISILVTFLDNVPESVRSCC